MDNLSEFIYLLSNRDLDEDDVNASAEAVRASFEDEELNWMDKDNGDPVDIERRQIFELENQLSDWFAVSDKIDELHEQIEEWFSSPFLPPFPYAKEFDTEEYFCWLDDLLANRPSGSYELLILDNGWDDNIHAVLVSRADTPRILELCKILKFTVYPTKRMFE